MGRTDVSRNESALGHVPPTAHRGSLSPPAKGSGPADQGLGGLTSCDGVSSPQWQTHLLGSAASRAPSKSLHAMKPAPGQPHLVLRSPCSPHLRVSGVVAHQVMWRFLCLAWPEADGETWANVSPGQDCLPNLLRRTQLSLQSPWASWLSHRHGFPSEHGASFH